MPPKYHNLKSKSKKKVNKFDLGELKDESEVFNSAEKEKQKVLQFEEQGVFADGLRVNDIHKVYTRSMFGKKSENDVHAVKGIFLEVPKNEMLCLLGHNGAGKSTLFNMLTGMISSTIGEGKIYGYNIKEN
jgi:ATP-binding cassette subfamily A (ABC1) protein 5